MRKLLQLPLILGLFLSSCDQDDAEVTIIDPQTKADHEIIEKMGFSVDGILESDYYYVVEGDIMIRKELLEEYRNTDALTRGYFYYGDDNLVEVPKLTIRIESAVNSKFKSIVEQAISEWNDVPNSVIKFTLGSSQSQNILIRNKNAFDPISSSEWTVSDIPLKGKAGKEIIINTECNDFESISEKQWLTNIIHALGHTLGFAHRYDSRSLQVPDTNFLEIYSFMYFGDNRKHAWTGFTPEDKSVIQKLYSTYNIKPTDKIKFPAYVFHLTPFTVESKITGSSFGGKLSVEELNGTKITDCDISTIKKDNWQVIFHKPRTTPCVFVVDYTDMEIYHSREFIVLEKIIMSGPNSLTQGRWDTYSLSPSPPAGWFWYAEGGEFTSTNSNPVDVRFAKTSNLTPIQVKIGDQIVASKNVKIVTNDPPPEPGLEITGPTNLLIGEIGHYHWNGPIGTQGRENWSYPHQATVYVDSGNDIYLSFPSSGRQTMRYVHTHGTDIMYTNVANATIDPGSVDFRYISINGANDANTTENFTYTLRKDAEFRLSQITWTPGAGMQIVSGQGTEQVTVKFTQGGRSTLKVSYRLLPGTGVYSHSKSIDVEAPPVIVEPEITCSMTNPVINAALKYTVAFPRGTASTSDYNIVWTFPNGEIVSGQGTDEFIARSNTRGNKQVTVTLTHKTNASITYTVNKNFNYMYDDPRITGPGDIRSGASCTLTATAYGYGAVTYEWSTTLPDQITATGKTVTFTAGRGVNRGAAAICRVNYGNGRYSSEGAHMMMVVK